MGHRCIFPECTAGHFARLWAAAEQPCGVFAVCSHCKWKWELRMFCSGLVKQLQNKAVCSALLCSHSSRCLPVLSAPFACFAIYFNRNLFSFREHPLKAARSPLLLCRMFSKSVTLHLSPKYKIPSLRLERCVRAGKTSTRLIYKAKKKTSPA